MRRAFLLATLVAVVGLAAPATGAAAKAYAVGDSVMLGAETELEKRGIAVDATVSRQLDDGVSLIRSLKAGGRLPAKVVVHLGTNGPISERDFAALMRLLSDRARVVVLTMKEPRSWEAANNQVIKKVVTRFPNAVLIDWHWWGTKNPGWFWSDGIHLRPEGAKAYARLVAKALKG